ncbi:hypothetical protein [Flavobacterium sp.]|uniref:hypothetical protein n=1 Tax=Flavobacterium sp. TaxID=239 RepID=UPI0037C0049B
MTTLLRKKFHIILIGLLTSCGQSTEFTLKSFSTELIQDTDKSKGSPDYTFISDTLKEKSKIGLVFNFDVDYSGSGGSQEPGNKGTKDTITKFEVLKINNEMVKNITQSFHNKKQIENSNYLYATDFIDIDDFVKTFNELYVDNQNNNYQNRIKTGWKLEGSQYVFWLNHSEAKSLKKGDTLRTKIELTTKKVLKNETVIK